MPVDRFFLDPNGAITRRMVARPGEGHYEIGVERLAQDGVVPKDAEDVYRQMFRLKFVRVVVDDEPNTVEIEHGPALTRAQEVAVEQLRRAGKRVVQKRATISG